MLTVEEMGTIVADVTLGRDPSITTPEALEFREAVEPEIAEAKAKGYTVTAPHEMG